jgi:menaquinone-dependent protoporphyrinogen IX oxidase
VKTVAAFLTIAVLLAGRPAGGQSDSVASVKEASVRILIAKGHSYLENTVAALIADSLPEYTVTAIPLQELAQQNRQDYEVIVLFNAIHRDRINSAVDKYIKTTENYGTHSNLLICTVFGEKWKGKEIAMDAVTTATKTLNPETVASRVLANIRLAIREKH